MTLRFLLLLLLAGTIPAGESFTLAVIPDTQKEMHNPTDARAAQRMEWLVRNREAKDIRFVLHVGDMVDWDTPDHGMYAHASKALEVLDRAGMPYACTLGNHDTAAVKVGGSAAPGNVRNNLRITTTFNTFFPVARFKALGGVFEPGKVDNAWHTFKAGGLDWMVINLELWPRAEAVAWARQVATEHPGHNVIVLTHSFLNGGAKIEQRNGGYGDNSPQYVVDHFIKHCPNVRLVFSGHVGKDGHRRDTYPAGHTVDAFLQCYHDGAHNPVRLFTIVTAPGRIAAQLWTPSADADKPTEPPVVVEDVTWVQPTAAQR